MAKKTYMLYKMVSSASTGFWYLGKKSTKSVLNKVCLRKYDPLVNEYVIFNEQKMKSGRKR